MTQSKPRMLTRIRLINWHYFSNETIQVKGSFLLSGDNSSGKSTVLDAIQMILTTSTRNFNEAAQNQGNRSLKGYVRGKTGVEGQTYKIPANRSTISYVALEFYEPQKERYFVLGVKLDSPNEESDVRKGWFCEEGKLDAFTFLVDGKPATDQQFKKNHQKVSLIRQSSEAKERFRRRMGNLGSAFFDLIPKSMAFRPMKDVKSFINQYILPAHPISTEALRENIHTLQELQQVIEQMKRQISQLEEILEIHRKVGEIQRQHQEIQLILKYASQESVQEQMDTIAQEQQTFGQQKLHAQQQKVETDQQLVSEQNALAAIQAAIASSDNGHLIHTLEQEIQMLERERLRFEEELRVLKKQLGNARTVQENLADEHEVDFGRMLDGDDDGFSQRTAVVIALRQRAEKKTEALRQSNADLRNQCQKLQEQISQLQGEIGNLEKNRFSYPETTELLRTRIREEFTRRGIDASVSVFAELLELKETAWQNALEGYLNTQRFYLFVPPAYYDIAAQVYDRYKSTIHSAALVNTQALDLEKTAEPDSLAAVVTSENPYAMAYACYVLNRVKRCQSVEELKKHSAAITASCMLYQGKVLRKLAPSIYQEPYIGRMAIRQQLERKRDQLAQLSRQLAEQRKREEAQKKQIDQLTSCNFDLLLEHLAAPVKLCQAKEQLTDKKVELNQAQQDRTYLEWQMKLEQCQTRLAEIQAQRDKLSEDTIRYETAYKRKGEELETCREQLRQLEQHIRELGSEDLSLPENARKRYEHLRQRQLSSVIAINYQPQLAKLAKQQESQILQLQQHQARYRECELGLGLEQMQAYFDEYDKLSRHDLQSYSSRLLKAQQECQEEFRESFLARMRENMEQAEDIFRSLNKTLKSICYGEDIYQFRFAANPQKKNLYDMMMSQFNIGGTNLFSQSFESSFQSEMEELFLKLTLSDDEGKSVLAEYSDYRTYLDYDIEIRSRSGNRQLFSKIYGEKSGGETQTPYYVAIAASFAQVYNSEDSVRLIMLDEAFDKMDDGRIESMMNFFQSLHFQVILAAPTAKIETLGPYVDTVLVAYREDYESMIEEYDV